MAKAFFDKLNNGGLVVAEGYLFEFQSRGYLKAGGFVPEVVLEHPDLVLDMHREFVHAGSDVVLAFTYYAHREKMRLIGRESDIEKINRTALKLARQVADETGTLMAGNICNSTVYNKNDPARDKELYALMKEQIVWAVEGGADFIVAETYSNYGEAELALKAIKEFGNGLPAVITFAHTASGLLDGVDMCDAFLKMQKQGAAVVGLNCARGPRTMLSALKEITEVYKGPVAALPVVYRTDEEHPTFQSLNDVDNPERSAFPLDLDAWLCSISQIEEFGKEAWKMGIRYLGLCCGNRAHYTRTLAESIGRKPAASKYSPDMKMHYSRIKDDRHTHTQGTFQEIYKTK